jgi:hypothetical protein
MKLSPVSLLFITLIVGTIAYILCVKPVLEDKDVAKQSNTIEVNDTTITNDVRYEGTSGVVTINDSVIVVKMKRVK